jgi:acetyl-CoA carboxylase biotin carboxyl carrier protein
VDIADLREILRILEAQDITEFELEQEGVKLRICRATGSAGAAGPAGVGHPAAVPPAFPGFPPPPLATPAAQQEAAAAPGAAAPERAEGGTVVKSPIVGTFYRSPDPSAPAFVNVGDKVKVGQILCIIEAMKLMNEIEAELAGEILTIHPENGQPVQYGDPLFTIRVA